MWSRTEVREGPGAGDLMEASVFDSTFLLELPGHVGSASWVLKVKLSCGSPRGQGSCAEEWPGGSVGVSSHGDPWLPSLCPFPHCWDSGSSPSSSGGVAPEAR